MHPAAKQVEASKKRHRAVVEGRACGGSMNRPGRARGGAVKDGGTGTFDSNAAARERDNWGCGDFTKRADGGGIHIKASHKGLLHKDLGVPEGEKIPAAKMERAKADASPAERKRITFAENARHWGK